MALKVSIDLNNTYDLAEISEDLAISRFDTATTEKQNIVLIISISTRPHALLPDVYNLSFGPLDKKQRIDDRAEISHADPSKVFSTILFSALTYLKANPDRYLGIDGSNQARAILYYKFIRSNYDYLNHYFEMFGLKYYVRITRMGKEQYDDPFDFHDIKPVPSAIVKDEPSEWINYITILFSKAGTKILDYFFYVKF